jgi:C1A family cysteine protease
VQIPSGNPKILKESLLKGPITALISASSPVFKFYSKGIIDDLSLEKKGSFMKCDGKINHAVLIVGWGVDNNFDQDYFIVKNSFGE